MAARWLKLALGVGAIALGSCGASAGTGARTGAGGTPAAACRPSGAHTLAADRQARVFTVSGIVYGCAERTGERYRLGQTRTCIGTDRVAPVALAGALVAYGAERCGVDTGFSQVVVRDLAGGGRTRRDEAATTTALGPESYVSVDAVVVKTDASIGWIASGESIVGHHRIREVHRADRGGRALLDSGRAIDGGSLRLRGSSMTWRHGRASRSAALR